MAEKRCPLPLNGIVCLKRLIESIVFSAKVSSESLSVSAAPRGSHLATNVTFLLLLKSPLECWTRLFKDRKQPFILSSQLFNSIFRSYPNGYCRQCSCGTKSASRKGSLVCRAIGGWHHLKNVRSEINCSALQTLNTRVTFSGSEHAPVASLFDLPNLSSVFVSLERRLELPGVGWSFGPTV
jgi:hypothetical protein